MQRIIPKIVLLGFIAIFNTPVVHAEDEHHHHKHMHGAPSEEQVRQFTNRENAVSQMSQKGNYRFTLFSTEAPIPLQRIHNWTVHVETKDGQPVEDARVFVFGGMPMHRHGFPTKPRVKKYLGNGDYKVEGIKFNMPGHWQMRFNISHKGKSDRVVYDIHLSY